MGRIRIFALVAFAASAGAAHAGGISGFMPGTEGATPVQGTYDGTAPPVAIAEPGKRLVVVYNHGTHRPQQVEDCSKSVNRVPRSLLDGVGATKGQAIVYYLCSGASERTTRKTAGEYIYKRMAEVERVLDQILAAGVAPERIFVAGHSAGGWTSLMLGKLTGKKFNAAIVFAPAFAGPRYETEKYPWWRKEARPRQVKQMLEAPAIRALVFAYAHDPFNRPEDLEFLTRAYPETVRLVGYECPLVRHIHLTHLQDCREAKTEQTIEDYVRARTGK